MAKATPETFEPITLAMHQPITITMPKAARTRRRIGLPKHYPDVRVRILSTASVYLEHADHPDGSALEGSAFETVMPVGNPVARKIRRGEFVISVDKGSATVELTAEPDDGRP